MSYPIISRPILANNQKNMCLGLAILFVWMIIFTNITLAESNQSSTQGSQFTINRYTIDAGAGVSSSADYQLTGTLAQADTAQLQSDDYVINGGFWSPNSGLASDLIFADGFEN